MSFKNLFVFLAFISTATNYGYIFRFSRLSQKPGEPKGPGLIIFLGDEHVPSTNGIEQREHFIQGLNDLHKKYSDGLNKAGKPVVWNKSKILVITESFDEKDAYDNKTASAYAHFRASINDPAENAQFLHHVHALCKKEGFSTHNAECRHVSAASVTDSDCKLNVTVNDVLNDMKQFFDKDAIKQLYRDKRIEKIAQHEMWLAGALFTMITEHADRFSYDLTLEKLIEKVAQECSKEEADSLEHAVKVGLTFMVDLEIVHALSKASTTDIVFVCAGTTHVQKCIELLVELGYVIDTNFITPEMDTLDGHPIYWPLAVDQLFAQLTGKKQEPKDDTLVKAAALPIAYAVMKQYSQPKPSTPAAWQQPARPHNTYAQRPALRTPMVYTPHVAKPTVIQPGMRLARMLFR